MSSSELDTLQMAFRGAGGNNQEPLSTTDLRHWASKRCQVEGPVRPVEGMPDAPVIAAFNAEIMGCILRIHKLLTAVNAEIMTGIHRMADRPTQESVSFRLNAGGHQAPLKEFDYAD
jgi:hypothetical protein